MKTEIWLNNKIRFVEVNGEWVAVSKDVASALDYADPTKAIRDHVDKRDKIMGVQNGSPSITDELGRQQFPTLITEFGIYDLVFSSKKPEAKQFKRWVFSIIKELRQSSGLQGFEIFRMLDKEHQKQAMSDLQHGLKNPVQINFVKANTVANKAVSNKFGYPKMLKKGEMTPEMLVEREPILNDTVELMAAKDKYNLDVSVSKAIYEKA